MNAAMLSPLAGWLLTVALHGSLFLAAAWLLDRAAPLPRAWRETLWRFALFGGVLTASLQPLAAAWHLHVGDAGPQFAAAAPLAAQPPATAARAMAAVAAPAPPAAPPAPAAPALPAAPVPAAAAVMASPASVRTVSPLLRAVARHAPAWTVGLWLAGALPALARLLAALAALRRTLRRAAPVSLPGLRNVPGLAIAAGAPEPRFYSLPDLAGPIAASGGRIVLPSWALTLDTAQLRVIVAHELAHLGRRDPAWKLLVAGWRALFWFLPLAGAAQRRLDELAELACDGFAARQDGDPRRVAECLAACAEHLARGSLPALAAAMAGRDSPLVQRIDHLLDGAPMESTATGLRPRLAAAAAIAGFALSLPAVSFLQSEPAMADAVAAGHDSSHTTNHRRITTLRIDDDQRQLEVTIRGRIDFNDAETDVASLGPGDTATFEETRDGHSHRLALAERDGTLERRYALDGRERPLDDEGRAWLAKLVPSLIRESGLGAEARVQRLYAQGGAPRVLDETARIRNDFVRGVYLGLLDAHGPLAPNDLDRALTLAAGLDSDYARRQALQRLAGTQRLGPAQQLVLLHAAGRIGTDYDRAELLIGIEPKLSAEPAVRSAWLDAAKGLGSDYERRRTLQALLAHRDLDQRQLEQVLEAGATIGSDYDRGQLLIAVAAKARDLDAIAPAYARAASTIGSDYEHGQALLALMGGGPLDARAAGAVLDSIAQIHGDYSCRQALVALSRVMPRDAALAARYRAVASRLSDYDRDQAELALVR